MEQCNLSQSAFYEYVLGLSLFSMEIKNQTRASKQPHFIKVQHSKPICSHVWPVETLGKETKETKNMFSLEPPHIILGRHSI